MVIFRCLHCTMVIKFVFQACGRPLLPSSLGIRSCTSSTSSCSLAHLHEPLRYTLTLPEIKLHGLLYKCVAPSGCRSKLWPDKRISEPRSTSWDQSLICADYREHVFRCPATSSASPSGLSS